MARKSAGSNAGGNVVDADELGDIARPDDGSPNGPIDPVAAFGGNSDDDGASAASDGAAPKRRGRKPGSRNKPKIAPTENLAGIEKVLFSMHAMLAVGMQTPELALTEPESKAVAASIAEVQRHYPNAMDPKTLAWINLAMVLGGVYVPRGIVIARKRRVRATTGVPIPEAAPVKAPAPNMTDIQVPSQLYNN